VRYDIVISGAVGVSGTIAFAREGVPQLYERYSRTYIDRAMDAAKQMLMPPALKDIRLYEIGAGGIYAALWKAAKEAGCGLRVKLYDIPVRQDIIEICNTLDKDPYTLESKGQYLIFTPDGLSTVDELKAAGYTDAALAGYTTDDKKRLIIYGDVERFLTPPERG